MHVFSILKSMIYIQTAQDIAYLHFAALTLNGCMCTLTGEMPVKRLYKSTPFCLKVTYAPNQQTWPNLSLIATNGLYYTGWQQSQLFK